MSGKKASVAPQPLPKPWMTNTGEDSDSDSESVTVVVSPTTPKPTTPRHGILKSVKFANKPLGPASRLEDASNGTAVAVPTVVAQQATVPAKNNVEGASRSEAKAKSDLQLLPPSSDYSKQLDAAELGSVPKASAKRTLDDLVDVDLSSDDDNDNNSDGDNDGKSKSSARIRRNGRTSKRPNEHTEMQDMEDTLIQLRKWAALSLASVGVSILLTAWSLFLIKSSYVLLILLVLICMALTGMICIIFFYHEAFDHVLGFETRYDHGVNDNAAPNNVHADVHKNLPFNPHINLPYIDSNTLQKYSHKFTHIVLVCLVMILVETIAAYQTMIVVIFNMRVDLSVCPGGISSAFDLLTLQGQAIYVLLFLDFALSMFCFLQTIRRSLVLSLFYLRQTYLHKFSRVDTGRIQLPQSNVERISPR